MLLFHMQIFCLHLIPRIFNTHWLCFLSIFSIMYWRGTMWPWLLLHLRKVNQLFNHTQNWCTFIRNFFFLWIQQVFYAFVLQGLLGAASHEDMLTHTLSAWEGWQHHRNVIWFFRAKLTITWKVHYILLCRRYWYKEYVVEFTALLVSTKNVFICDELHKSVLIMYAKNLSVNIIHCCT